MIFLLQQGTQDLYSITNSQYRGSLKICYKLFIIFIARYIKALEAIRKFRKEQTTEVKKFKTELDYLKANKDKADEVRIDRVFQDKTRYPVVLTQTWYLQLVIHPNENVSIRWKTRCQLSNHIFQIAENMEKTLKRFEEAQQQVDDIKTSMTPVEVSLEMKTKLYAVISY